MTIDNMIKCLIIICIMWVGNEYEMPKIYCNNILKINFMALWKRM